jgi:acyl dehydratase
MAVDTSVIGKTTSRSVVAVERGPVTNFARSVKDDSPIYANASAARAAGFTGIPAPPTWSFAMGFWGSQPELQAGVEKVEGNPMFEIIGKLMSKGGLVLHGEQEFTYHRPIVAGDVLVGTGTCVDAYEKESKGKVMTFVVSETVWSNQSTGEAVVTERFNLIHRGA